MVAGSQFPSNLNRTRFNKTVKTLICILQSLHIVNKKDTRLIWVIINGLIDLSRDTAVVLISTIYIL